MLKKLANFFIKYFIPHEHNDYKPHILRSEATVFILAIIILAEFIFLAQIFIFYPGKGFLAQILQNVLIEETNENRIADDISSLIFNPTLAAAAQAKAEDMAQKGYFSHVSSDGTSPWYWFKLFDYEYDYAGENLAVNFSDSKDVVNAWMNSPGHRDNILNKSYTEIGIGIAEGLYQNRKTVFVVQFFGRPTIKEPTAVVSTVQPKQQAPAVVVNENEIQGKIQEAKTPEKVLSIESTNNAASSVGTGQNALAIEEAIVSPRTRTQYLYFVLLGLIGLASILNIFIKIKVQHPRIIFNGVALIVIINTALFVNNYLAALNPGII